MAFRRNAYVFASFRLLCVALRTVMMYLYFFFFLRKKKKKKPHLPSSPTQQNKNKTKQSQDGQAEYNLFDRNCQHYSNGLFKKLTGKLFAPKKNEIVLLLSKLVPGFAKDGIVNVLRK